MSLKLAILILSVQTALSWRFFNRGRDYGGNLGQPNNTLVQDIAVLELWLTQNLDHFNPSDTRTWQQRYFINEQYYDHETGPVFLLIGGEGEASLKWMTQGAWITYAKHFKALCFQVEHRYYGKSHPTEDLSTKNLQYLTSQQALADLANFITSMNIQYKLSKDTKWIVFGGSYSGSLAAWIRLKYPHLVLGAVASSGPLLAQVDFSAYFRVVTESLASYSVACVDLVKLATEKVGQLLKTSEGLAYLNKEFRVCDPLEASVKVPNDIANFYETLSDNFAGIVQYNKVNRITNNTKISKITINTLCDIMTNETLPVVERLSAVNSLIMDASDQKCLDYKYNRMVQELQAFSWDSGVSEGGRQWYYQTCTEFGFFQTSSYGNHIFGDNFPVDFFIQQCMDVFGARYNKTLINKAAERTNIIYGALDIKTSNVVFVHGSIDPWHALGITQSINSANPAIYIKGTAHCANMYPESSNDSRELRNARAQISKYIATWLGV